MKNDGNTTLKDSILAKFLYTVWLTPQKWCLYSELACITPLLWCTGILLTENMLYRIGVKAVSDIFLSKHINICAAYNEPGEGTFYPAT